MKVGLILCKCFITYSNSVSISFVFSSWIINELAMYCSLYLLYVCMYVCMYVDNWFRALFTIKDIEYSRTDYTISNNERGLYTKAATTVDVWLRLLVNQIPRKKSWSCLTTQRQKYRVCLYKKQLYHSLSSHTNSYTIKTHGIIVK